MPCYDMQTLSGVSVERHFAFDLGGNWVVIRWLFTTRLSEGFGTSVVVVFDGFCV